MPVGVAVVDITPDYPIRMVGYESRKTESEGVVSRLKARALAIGGDDGDGPTVLVAIDNCAIGTKISEDVAARLKAKVGLKRERFVVCATHTHCGPALQSEIPFIFGKPLPADQAERIARYTRELTDAIEKAALQSLADRKPGATYELACTKTIRRPGRRSTSRSAAKTSGITRMSSEFVLNEACSRYARGAWISSQRGRKPLFP